MVCISFTDFSVKMYLDTVYREIFFPLLFSPSLSMGKFKTGQILMSQIKLSLNTAMSGQIQEVTLYTVK